MKFISHLIVTACLITPVLAHESQPSQAELPARIDAYLSGLEQFGFSGGVLVMREGEVLFQETYGLAIREPQLSMGPESAFPLGSISKQFTAAAILKLQMEGELDMQATLADFLDDVPADKSGITIHQLLTHSAGFPHGMLSVMKASSIDEYLSTTLAAELMYEPGTESEYSNLNFGLLAALVERISGTTFEEYLRDEVFLPAGMKHTGIMLPSWGGQARVHGYIDGQDQGSLSDGWPAKPWHMFGAGGVRTTLADMVQWEIAQRELLVLDAETLELMHTPHVLDYGMGTGYGCGVFSTSRGTKMIGHDGSNDIYAADWRRYLDEEVMIFAATNDADLYAFDVTPNIAKLVFGGDVKMPPALKPLTGALLAGYEGDYQLKGGGVIHVGATGTSLNISSGDQAAAKLVQPVSSAQVERRDALLVEVPAAYAMGFDGEFDAMRRLIDPFAPAQEFAGMEAERLAGMKQRHGAFKSARAVSGRNRFGEVAIVLELYFEAGQTMMEFSFSDQGIGAIRFIDQYPCRFLRPTSPTSFIELDVKSGTTWTLTFELDKQGVAKSLVLMDPSGEPQPARRL